MLKTLRNMFLLLSIAGSFQLATSQQVNSDTFKGLKFRNLGPALTSGRIADIAIHPENENIWYNNFDKSEAKKAEANPIQTPKIIDRSILLTIIIMPGIIS